MTGCRHNAKNTLVKNYLYLAEKAGATVHPLITAVAVRPLDARRVRGRHGAHRRVAGRADGALVHRRAGGVRGRNVGHAAAPAPDEGGGLAAGDLRAGWAS